MNNFEKADEVGAIMDALEQSGFQKEPEMIEALDALQRLWERFAEV